MQTFPGSRGTPPPARLAPLCSLRGPPGAILPEGSSHLSRSRTGGPRGAYAQGPALHPTPGPASLNPGGFLPQDWEGARRGGGRRGAAAIRTEETPAFPT